MIVAKREHNARRTTFNLIASQFEEKMRLLLFVFALIGATCCADDTFEYRVDRSHADVRVRRQVDSSSSSSPTPTPAPLPDGLATIAPEEAKNEDQIVDAAAGTPITDKPATERRRKDTFDYYDVKLLSQKDGGGDYRVDLDALEEAPKNGHAVYTHELLSKSHLKASLIKFGAKSADENPWHFPYYGHLLSNLTVATGGFLYTGKTDHSWIAATQYIAPLMAGFNPSLDESTKVRYLDNGTALTVEWTNIKLHEYKDNATNPGFTFQVTLHKSGDIVFYYDKLPMNLDVIGDRIHPVKIGISDAYLVERTWFILRRRTIFEYNRVNLIKAFNASDIRNGSAVLFRPKKTCLTLKSCAECIAGVHAESGSKVPFGCRWCHAANRCSDGVDRYYQDWVEQLCHQTSRNDSCEAPPPPPPRPVVKPSSTSPAHFGQGSGQQSPLSGGRPRPQSAQGNRGPPDVDNNIDDHQRRGGQQPGDAERQGRLADSASSLAVLQTQSEEGGISAAAILSIFVVIAVVVSLVGWLLFAYRYPTSSAGQFLIRYRPRTWNQSGESEDGNPHIRI